MADKLRWFPFYAGDWMTDQDVLELTGEQMGAYLWLLCLQWQQGALPYEAHRVVAMSPRGISEVAISYVLLKFFPPDPDTNERRNPKLAAIRERQLATYQVRVASVEKARKSKQVKTVSGDQTGHHVGDEDDSLFFSSQEGSHTEIPAGREGGVGGRPSDLAMAFLAEGLADFPEAVEALEKLSKGSKNPEMVYLGVRRHAPGGTLHLGETWADLAVGLVNATTGTPPYNLPWIGTCISKAHQKRKNPPAAASQNGTPTPVTPIRRVDLSEPNALRSKR